MKNKQKSLSAWRQHKKNRPVVKPLGQIAYEALAKRRDPHPDYTWNNTTELLKADYCAVASAVAREVRRRGRKGK